MGCSICYELLRVRIGTSLISNHGVELLRFLLYHSLKIERLSRLLLFDIELSWNDCVGIILKLGTGFLARAWQRSLINDGALGRLVKLGMLIESLKFFTLYS